MTFKHFENAFLWKERLLKHNDDKDVADSDLESTECPRYWAILADKRYKGADGMMRAFTPYKKPIRGVSSAEKEAFSKKLSSDRIWRTIFDV